MLSKLENRLQQLLFSKSEQQAFLEDISALIEDGVPVRQAVETVEEIAKGNAKKAATAIIAKISEGQQFADGMAGWFPSSIVEVIRAGEEGGTMAENMASAARAVNRQANIVTSLLGALLYPLIVIVLGLAVTVFIRHTIFVNFLEIRPLAQWPTEGRVLFHLADFVQHWWWAVLLGLIIFVLLMVRMFYSLTGPIRKMIDDIPGLALYRYVLAARLMETLGLLVTNGIPIKRALEILYAKASPYIAWHVNEMQLRLSGGIESVAEVIDTGLIRPADILRLRVIAKGKGFAYALIRLGQQGAVRNAKIAQLTGKVLGGFILALGAGLAAFMILGIYLVGSFVAT